MNQKGLAQILIVLLLAALAVGGYFVYQNKSVSSPQPIITPSLIPTSTSTPQPSPKPTTKPKISMKPTVKATPAPTSSSSPSPSPSGSPTPASKPSPVPGVYQLDLKPTSNIETSTSSYGYAASILLIDSNGDVVYDQSDFSFSVSIDNQNLADIQLGQDNDSCRAYNIKYEYGYQNCPNFKLSVTPKQAGSTKIPVKAIQKSTGKIVAEGTYSLTIK